MYSVVAEYSGPRWVLSQDWRARSKGLRTRRGTTGAPLLLLSVVVLSHTRKAARDGPEYSATTLYIKEMPKGASDLRLDFSSLLGPLFFLWVLGLPFPVMLLSLVYEKENRLRIMMKMHGLSDNSYWVVS